MSDNYRNHLVNLLKTDKRLIDEEGDLIHNKLKDFTLSLDEGLIELLLSDNESKEKFFLKVKEVYVFKATDFQFFIEENQLDNSFTSYANKIGLTINGKFLNENTDVVLDFPYKDCVLEGGQMKEDGSEIHFVYDHNIADYKYATAKRKEIFYNNIIAKDEIDRLFEPKAFTNIKRYSANGEESPEKINRDEQGNIKDNLIVKGNNLLALHSLLPEFKNKVQLIYIDPPYNTEKDSFIYNDKFTHSTWMTFMYNRLKIARDLLHESGCIYVQADWNEIHYLKILMDDVFGRINFRNEIVWFYENKFKFQFTKNFNNDTEGLLMYSKSNGKQKFKHVKVDVKNKRKQNQVTWDKELKKMVTVKDEHGNVVYYDSDSKIVGTLWNIPRINSQSKERLDLVGQKPEQLVKRIIEASTDEGDIVLDYHLGTGTTAAVAHKMGRQYIGVEQLDYIEDFTLNRLNEIILNNNPAGISKTVNWQGGGSFVYLEMAKNNQKAKELINACNSLEELTILFEELYTKYFLHYNVKIQEFKKKIIKEDAFIALCLDRQKEIFSRMLDNNQLYVNVDDMEDTRYGLSTQDILLTKDFYQIND